MQLHTLIRALGLPISWCFAAYMLSMQMSLFNMMGLSGGQRLYSADSPMFYHLVGLALCLGVLAVGWKRPFSLYRSALATALGAAAGVFGAVLLAAVGPLETGWPFVVAGCALLASSSILLGFQLQEYFGLLGAELKSVLVVGAGAEAILLLAYPALHRYGHAVVAVLLVVRAVLYWLSVKSLGGTSSELGEQPAPPRIGFPKTLMAGVAVLVMGWSFLQTAIYMGDDWLVTLLLAATKLLALVAFAYLMLSAHDLGFAPAGKLMCILILCAMALTLGKGSAYLSSGVMDVGYSLFELVVYVALADAVCHRSGYALKVIGAFYAVVHGSYLLGSALSLACDAGVLDGTLAETLLLMGLVVVALCCFDEKRVTGFFLAAASAEERETPQRPIAELPDAALARFDLTAREQEIALLYAKGRSAVYIAEELSISPHTVRSHVARIYEKCTIHSRQELLSLLENGDIS